MLLEIKSEEFFFFLNSRLIKTQKAYLGYVGVSYMVVNMSVVETTVFSLTTT